MIALKLLDQSMKTIPAEQGFCLLPYAGVFSHPSLQVDGILYFRGEVLPVHGPLPQGETKDVWLLHLGDRVQVIEGFPEFLEDQVEQEQAA